ncbi:MAG: carbon storage regulator [Gammaproteobacteria bacterium]
MGFFGGRGGPVMRRVILQGDSMLILTRRPKQAIYIGKEITLTVLGVTGDQVRIGIDAPRAVVIDREEVHEQKIRAAQRLAGVQSSADPVVNPTGVSPTGDVASQVASASNPASSRVKVTRKRRLSARNPRTNRIDLEVILRVPRDVQEDEGA